MLSSDRDVVSSAFIGTLNRAPLVALAVPTHDAQGRLTGLVAAGIRLDRLRIGADDLRYAGGTEVEIVDGKGQLVADRTPVDSLRTADAAFPAASLRASGAGVIAGVTSPDGVPDRLIGYSLVPTSGWLVLVDRSVAEALAPADQLLVVVIGLILVATALALGLLLWASRRLEVAGRRQAEAFAAERSARGDLERAVARLEERQGLRDAFIGVMSHELRTPVTTIYGAAKLLAKSPHRDDVESLISDIEEESDRLHRITEDLLVLSRAERGGLVVEPEPVLVQRLVPSIAADLRRRYPSTPFEFAVDDDLPPVAGEPGPIRQVLNNLLSNGAKYARGAPVRLRVDLARDAIRLVVEDEGPGFPGRDADRLFDLFYRSPTTERAASGTGIGLYVVHQLVEAMGGTVRAYNRRPHGAGFRVLLPPYDEDAGQATGAASGA